MYCRFCGKHIIEDSNFCPYCGKVVGEIDLIDSTYDIEKNYFDEQYYKRKVSQTASVGLVSSTKIICYVALFVFLIFNIKMSPSYGWVKIAFYITTSAITIGLVTIVQKKVFISNRKTLYIIVLITSVMVIVTSISLRIIYEMKVDAVRTQIPSSGEIVLSLLEETEYFNDTGLGIIRNPNTSIRLYGKWYKNGDKIPVQLNKEYFLRVSSGGTEYGGYKDVFITFKKSSFTKGKYEINKVVPLTDDATIIAEVNLVFERYCAFWEVVFN